MMFIIMNPFQLDVFCLLVPYPPARQQARKNCGLFHNGTAETNLGDPSAYLSKAYFVCSGNVPDIQNEMLVQDMTNIDEPLYEHVRMAVEMMGADIAHNFKIKNLSSSIGISRSHLTSLFGAAFGLPPLARRHHRQPGVVGPQDVPPFPATGCAVGCRDWTSSRRRRRNGPGRSPSPDTGGHRHRPATRPGICPLRASPPPSPD